MVGLYSSTGTTGESSSPSTSRSMALSAERKKLALSRRRASFCAPTLVPSAPVITRKDVRICAATTGDMAVSLRKPAELRRRLETSARVPAM